MKRGKLLRGIIAGFGAVVCLVIVWWLQPLNDSRSLQYAMQTEVSLTAWIYSKPVSLLLTEYQLQHPHINIEIRNFRSEQQLQEELAAALSAHMPPHMAEIGSGFGLAGLVDTDGLVSFNDARLAAAALTIDSRFTDAFMYKQQLWAMPYGVVVPVLYYNENLFRFSEAANAASVLNWKQLIPYSMRMTQDLNADGMTDIWGLVADTNAPWYLSGAITSGVEPGRAAEPYFHLWHDLVHRYKVMPALEHNLALSRFIDGAAGLLLAPSDVRTMLEPYIGGTFGFNVMPVPSYGEGRTAAVRVNGFVMPRSTPEIESIVQQIAAYLLEPSVQQRLFHEASKLPVLQGMPDILMEQANELTDREYGLLRIAVDKLHSEAALVMNRVSVKDMLLLQEQLEGDEAACIPCLVQDYEAAIVN